MGALVLGKSNLTVCTDTDPDFDGSWEAAFLRDRRESLTIEITATVDSSGWAGIAARCGEISKRLAAECGEIPEDKMFSMGLLGAGVGLAFTEGVFQGLQNTYSFNTTGRGELRGVHDGKVESGYDELARVEFEKIVVDSPSGEHPDSEDHGGKNALRGG